MIDNVLGGNDEERTPIQYGKRIVELKKPWVALVVEFQNCYVQQWTVGEPGEYLGSRRQ